MTIEGQKAVSFTVNAADLGTEKDGNDLVCRFEGGELRLSDKAVAYKLGLRLKEAHHKHCGQFRITLQTKLRATQWKPKREHKNTEKTRSLPETGSHTGQPETCTGF